MLKTIGFALVFMSFNAHAVIMRNCKDGKFEKNVEVVQLPMVTARGQLLTYVGFGESVATAGADALSKCVADGNKNSECKLQLWNNVSQKSSDLDSAYRFIGIISEKSGCTSFYNSHLDQFSDVTTDSF